MKKIILVISIITLLIACNKDEETPQPTPVSRPANQTGGNGSGNNNPPPTSTRFYVGLSASNYSTISVPVIPIVTVDNVSLIYVGNNLTSGITGTPYDVMLEYDIPSTLNVNCNDSVDFSVSFNTTNFDDEDKIQKIQIFYEPMLKLIPAWTSYWEYDIWAPINPKVFTYNNRNVHCQ